jgi:methyl-accepting chemotaxis protein
MPDDARGIHPLFISAEQLWDDWKTFAPPQRQAVIMRILSHLKIRTKLTLLLGMSALAVITSIGAAASIIHQRMFDDRVDKLRAVVQSTIAIAQSLEHRVTAHDLTREQALVLLRDDIHAIRFDGGAGYVTAWTTDGIVVAHGTVPALEGKPTPVADTGGRTVLQLGAEALQGSDHGVVAYAFPRPGQSVALPKIAYAALFAPWQMVLMSGVYVDDLAAAFHTALLRLASIGGAILLVTLLAAWLVNRDITVSLGRLKAAMDQLAKADLATEVPGTERRDEVGAMAGTLLIFKEHMVSEERLTAEQQQERERADTAKHTALVAMAEAIEAEAKAALVEVRRRTAAMAGTANGMSASAARTGASAQSAVVAAAQALANAQTVASAAEELTASIREIGGQVNQSAAVVERAVEAGRVTRETMEALNERVGRIGAVADMISEIAAKTNLLALNATIEAARAGDAGKGFAVVASEVKSLATQTAKSTEEIGRHIAEVRAATGESVTAVRHIEQTIGEINAIAGSIAAAVEEQGAATAEIARNVTETAAAANTMTERANEVSAEAGTTGQQAAEVRENTSALDAAMRSLQNTVVRVVRTATVEVDRRQYRRRPCLVEATIGGQGQSGTAVIHDISERGCFAVTTLRCQRGKTLDIGLARLGTRLGGIVVEQAEDGLRIAFTGEGLATADADGISLATIGDLVKLTKGDHTAFVKRVADAVAAHDKLPPEELATSHQCRLGHWYDGVGDQATLALPSFKAIDEPHHAVHDCGRKALAALAGDDTAAAQRHVAEMRRHSDRVLHELDELGRAYPATVGADRSDAAMAA